MPHLSKASNVVQSKYILYDITDFTQKLHLIPVATKSTYKPQAKKTTLRTHTRNDQERKS